MAITAAEIHNQSFSIDRKGYDVDEVDVFLEHVADEIDGLNAQIADLEEQLSAMPEVEDYVEVEDDFAGFDAPAAPDPEPIDESEALAEKNAIIEDLRRQIADHQADGNAIAQALIIAQRSADETIANAKMEAARIIKNAEAEADRIVGEAEDERNAVLDEIKQLEDDCEATRTDYQNVLKDVISDATTKLHALGESAFSGYHASGYDPAKYAAPMEILESSPVIMEPAKAAPANPAVGYVVPQAGAVIGAAAVPVPSVIEKDFSGFGDADNSFEFDELD